MLPLELETRMEPEISYRVGLLFSLVFIFMNNLENANLLVYFVYMLLYIYIK